MSDQSSEKEPPSTTRRARMLRRADASDVPVRTILVTVGIVAGAYFSALFLYRMRDLLMLALVGAFLALILNPAVVALQRWGLRRRGPAVGVVALVTILVFIGLAFAFGYPLIRSLTHLSETLPAYVHNAQHGTGWIGELLRRYHVSSWITQNSTKLVSLAKGLSRPALALGRGAVSVLLALMVVFTLMVMLLLEGPKIRAFLFETMEPRRAAQFSRIGAEVSRSALGYVLGNLVTSVIAGVVVFVTLALLGVPFALLFGLWVALVDFLPTIGGALAGVPTVLFAFGHSLSAGIITLIVFLVYTQIENHVLNPYIMSRSVRLNPLTVFVAVLVGAEVGSWVGGLFGGFIGVLLAVPGAAAIQVLAKEVWHAAPPKQLLVVGDDEGPHEPMP